MNQDAGASLANGSAGEGPLLLTARQAAKALQVSERTLWTLSHSGKLARVKVGHLVRYSIDDLRRFISEQRVGYREATTVVGKND